MIQIHIDKNFGSGERKKEIELYAYAKCIAYRLYYIYCKHIQIVIQISLALNIDSK